MRGSDFGHCPSQYVLMTKGSNFCIQLQRYHFLTHPLPILPAPGSISQARHPLQTLFNDLSTPPGSTFQCQTLRPNSVASHSFLGTYPWGVRGHGLGKCISTQTDRQCCSAILSGESNTAVDSNVSTICVYIWALPWVDLLIGLLSICWP